MTTYRPRNEHVLILPDEARTMQGTLYLPPGAVKAPSRGTVVAVGPGWLLTTGERQALDIEAGGRVHFYVQQGQPSVELDGQIHLIVKEDQILGVLEDEPPGEMLMPSDDDDEDEDDLGVSDGSPGEPRIVISTT